MGKRPGRQREFSPVHPDAAAIDIGATMHMAAVAPGCDAEPVRSFGTFTGDLHRLGFHLAIVVDAPRSLLALPQPRIGRRHFGHGIPCPQLLAQLAERTVGHTRHGGDEHVVAQGIGPNVHDVDQGEVRGRALF